jgi:hypothetical protein
MQNNPDLTTRRRSSSALGSPAIEFVNVVADDVTEDNTAAAVKAEIMDGGKMPMHADSAGTTPRETTHAIEHAAWWATLYNLLVVFVRKWKGVPGKTSSPIPHVSEAWYSFCGAFAGIACLAGLQYNFPQLSHASLTMLVASFGASAVLLYGTPTVPLAQPRNVVLGHMLSAVVGVAVRMLVLELACDRTCMWLGSALGVALAIVVMTVTGTVHPPGGATALLAVVGDATIRDLGFYFVLMPAGAGAVLMVLIALVVNNVFPARQYPQYWW